MLKFFYIKDQLEDVEKMRKMLDEVSKRIKALEDEGDIYNKLQPERSDNENELLR